MTTISATFHVREDDDIAHTINGRLKHATLVIGPNATIIAGDPIVLRRIATEAGNAAAELEAMLAHEVLA